MLKNEKRNHFDENECYVHYLVRWYTRGQVS